MVYHELAIELYDIPLQERLEAAKKIKTALRHFRKDRSQAANSLCRCCARMGAPHQGTEIRLRAGKGKGSQLAGRVRSQGYRAAPRREAQTASASVVQAQ